MKSEFFSIDELLPPEVLGVLCDGAAWRLVAPFASSLDMIRKFYGGPVTVNSANLRYCGLRPRICSTGASRSSHKGVDTEIQGFDLHAKDLDHLISIVKTNSKELRIVRMEDPAVTRSWVHVEISSGPVESSLVIFRP